MSGEHADRVGLEAADFRLTNASGFGDGNNSYAHSMAWFEGHLYVGTTRGVFAMMRTNKPVPNFKPWPTEVPDSPYKVDRRAEIWRYTPATSGWDLVYRAPWVIGRTIAQVPRYIGFRGMTIFQSPGDAKPCLYVSTWAPREAEPPDILRSEDGVTFESVPRPPWDTAVRSFRTLQVFRGRVHTAPTGSNKGGQAQESVGSEARVYCTDDLQSAHWVSAGEDGFGDPDNVTVFEMAAFADHLYAGTVNPTRGCELWKTDGEGGPPYRWQRVLSHGAGRGPHNEAIASMVVFGGALYVGTGIVNGGYHRAFEVGPAAAEVLRVWPDDSWDVLVGHSRITPDGLKVPLSGMAPGFDSLFNGYMWRMGVHDGHLYVGTFCWANMLPYLPRSLWPEDVLAMVERWGEDQLVRRYGGFELWRTADGVRWFPVTRSGFGNKYNWGVRNLVSTPHGLFVGTANVFGPRVAVRRDGEWRYIDNPRGGCEVWLGAREAV
ncbi:MAG TPA: hypothetical protein VFQ88_12775 [Nevskiaceae bacterium]|nr:hypothetical protein [Nevskiaceae bacterium]